MRASILEMLKLSPETTILVDEAYHEYATDPEYETMIPLALENPRVVVARTFSKAYGMAGLRIGYGVSHEDTIKKMSEWRGMDMFTSVPGRTGAVAAIGNGRHVAQEIERNEAVRRATRKFFHDAGYEDTDSQANFVYVETSNPCFNIEANLISPTLDFSAFANPQIAFFYHAYGTEIVELNVQVSTDNCLSWSTEFQLLGQQQFANGDPWLQAVVDLSAYAGMSNLRIRFNYLSGPSFHGDVALDTILVWDN